MLCLAYKFTHLVLLCKVHFIYFLDVSVYICVCVSMCMCLCECMSMCEHVWGVCVSVHVNVCV